eukprot:CAMPEP_0172480510 /NCGR_PEP_ID=MMETSP1066-20121228/5694_1 /TAXON_ID=671091 /ORGANISM="Coscinodiscus wailesii, Strain CCMP2513" /LENGTH=204 /DNA_ID=CAMNT_0013241891 /DNA_START=121 /DNA_END=735 /DNA_ORIENTATION=-
MKLIHLLFLPVVAQSYTISTFQGKALLTHSSTPVQRQSSRCTIEMKKGKPNVPVNMRGDYKRRQEMANQREQMLAAQTPGEDGLPVFNLFVRTKVANMWYPCGSFKGDDRSKALCTSLRDNGLLAGISKNQLDKGVSGSLYRDLPKLVDSICRAYPQLRKSRDELEWGYKLGFEGLSEEQSKINLVTPEESKGFFDNVKGSLGL